MFKANHWCPTVLPKKLWFQPCQSRKAQLLNQPRNVNSMLNKRRLVLGLIYQRLTHSRKKALTCNTTIGKGYLVTKNPYVSTPLWIDVLQHFLKIWKSLHCLELNHFVEQASHALNLLRERATLCQKVFEYCWPLLRDQFPTLGAEFILQNLFLVACFPLLAFFVSFRRSIGQFVDPFCDLVQHLFQFGFLF